MASFRLALSRVILLNSELEIHLGKEIFLLSQEKNPSLTDIILPLSQEVFFLSQDFFLWQEMFLLLRVVLCASHEEYFLSQEWFFIFLHHKKYFSCGTKRICSFSFNEFLSYVLQQYFSCHENYFFCERE